MSKATGGADLPRLAILNTSCGITSRVVTGHPDEQLYPDDEGARDANVIAVLPDSRPPAAGGLRRLQPDSTRGSTTERAVVRIKPCSAPP